MKAVIIQSTFDFALREINALEHKIVFAEDDADAMLWEQARQVVEQLNAKVSQRKMASQWINGRTGVPYSHVHVHRTAQVVGCYLNVTPRPRFRECYNEIANAEPAGKLAVHQSSESVEHYTPREIVTLVQDCLGEIDLDPCSDPLAAIPARRHYTKADDGLAHPWQGRVYMNPPYGDGIQQWITKLCTEHESGDVSEAIVLVPARPDTQWFKCLRNYVCCFVEGRLTFIGSTDPAPFPSAIFYLGEDIGKFYRSFTGLGDIWQRIEPGMFAE